MTESTPTHAAGGIVCRTIGDRTEVLIVHRPRYDDWSLPKGHVDEGETVLAAALREVVEETGYTCEPTRPAGSSSYSTRTGEPKVVHYWVMTVTGGEFTPNDEVDRIAWMTVEEAARSLSYDLDRELVRTTLGPT